MDELFQALLQAKNPHLEELQAMPRASGEDVNSMLVGALAGAAGLPVDLMTTAMRPFGYDVPPNQVYGSSDWIGDRLGANTDSGAFLAGQFLSPDPFDAVKAANGLDNILGAMTLFHGSPHKWDAVDLSRVGTGEGNQAYGHGFYAAENPRVAEEYRDMVRPAWDVSSDPYNEGRHVGMVLDHQTMPYARKEFELREDAERWARETAESIGGDGHLYELDVPDEAIDKMLDWDAPLSEQPESVRESIRAALVERGMGNEYDGLLGHPGQIVMQYLMPSGNKSEASERMLRHGIPGIKYLDGTSRSAGKGTRNVVIFDENLVKVLKRNNEPVK